MKEVLDILFQKSMDNLKSAKKNLPLLADASKLISKVLIDGGTIFLLPNGGDSALSQHIAGKFVSTFNMERPALPVVSLSTNSTVINSIANHYNYDDVPQRQIRAFVRPGDLVWVFSSQQDGSLLKAIELVKNIDANLICMAGHDKFNDLSDLAIEINALSAPSVQEIMLIYSHIICEFVDRIIFEAFSFETSNSTNN